MRVRFAVGLMCAAAASAGLLAFGCTFLVDFQAKSEDGGLGFDAEGDDASIDDGGGTGDEAGDEAGTTDGTADNPCVGRANGYLWDPVDEYARCCNGIKVRTTSDEFCGTCEIACNKAKGQSCQLFRNRYYCRGCDANADCWSGCCSKQFGGGSCAASNCTTGDCNAALCKGGSVCVVPGDASNYCKY
jgi:hypothetical protein